MPKLRCLAMAIAAVLWTAPAAAHEAKSHTAMLLVEEATGTVLEAENPTHPWFPASLTKVMTAYMVFEALADGRLALDEKIPVSKHAVAQPPSKLGLGLGKNVRVKLLLEAMIVRSANDAAVVLAEAVSGSEAAFAEAMTRKARALGMTQTVFRNASGLPDREQITTARDMAILARALIRDFPERFALFGKHRFRLGKRTHPSTNAWAKGYPGAEGIKTGFTCGSGYNLLGSVERDGRRLIGVVLGGRNSGRRNARMTKLMDAGFAGDPAPEGSALLDELRGQETAAAPYVLPGNKCAATSMIGGGHLPGWGVIFGSFVKKAKAKEVIKRNRKVLKGVAKRGRPAIIPRAREGQQRYSALLVGLKQADAGQACERLRTLGIYCLSLAPDQLNNPKAIWR